MGERVRHGSCALTAGTQRAVFLDRDGVLNHNVFYGDTQCWESPRQIDHFRLIAGVVPALKLLRDAGFLLFLVSNQPNAAKGKSTPEALAAMHEILAATLRANNLAFAAAFYCTHHPDFTGPCLCRKPSPYFLKTAAFEHALSLGSSWMIGDRATDMQCGRSAGVRTAWVRTGQEQETPADGLVDVFSKDMPDAARQILAEDVRPPRMP